MMRFTSCLLQALTIAIIINQIQAIDFWPFTSSKQPRFPIQDDEITSRSKIDPVRAFARLQESQDDLVLPRYRCVDPDETNGDFELFARQYDRKLSTKSGDFISRKLIFLNTIKRAIFFNQIVGLSLANHSKISTQPDVANYYLISPKKSNYSWSLWYADINDCELGLMKKDMFQIMRAIDGNYMYDAYEKALNVSHHFPFMSSQGFQQMAEILLIRLFDRFNGDEYMNMLFNWPSYAKRLASYAYNQLEASQPYFKSKLALVSFAYPSFFKDIKYNPPAVNLTQDNLVSRQDHEEFIRLYSRRHTNVKERTRRFRIFRQRASHLRLLSQSVHEGSSNRHWFNDEQMARLRRVNEPLVPTRFAKGYIPPSYMYNNAPVRYLSEEQGENLAHPIPLPQNPVEQWRSQYSDLTDEEFVAYLTQDFGILDKDQIRFIDDNFPVQAFTSEFRDELAFELLFRRTIQEQMSFDGGFTHQSNRDKSLTIMPYSLARQVVDDLIASVGLPIGPSTLKPSSDVDTRDVFNLIGRSFGKIYARSNLNHREDIAPNQPSYLPVPDERDAADELVTRYENFKQNYERFRAWWAKDSWNFNSQKENQVNYLRLADMSWIEIKLVLFKICCLSKEELHYLSRNNITLHYLASQSFLCNPIADIQDDGLPTPQLDIFEAMPAKLIATSRMPENALALELYYYYLVHFNKHHSTLQTLSHSFNIFRSNIEQIKRQSCLRSWTLSKAFELKRDDLMNTIDVIDSRRQYLDDINLDRYIYFTIPNPKAPSNNQARARSRYADDSGEIESARLRQPTSSNPVPFNSLNIFKEFASNLDSMRNTQNLRSERPYYDIFWRPDDVHKVNQYQLHRASNVYEVVADRYRLCKLVDTGYEPSDYEISRRECKTTHLTDQSDAFEGSNSKQDLSRAAPCDFYFHGLDSWSNKLSGPSMFAKERIQNAKC